MALVCIVDDSPTTRASVEYTLKSAEYTVLACESGEDALDKLKGEPEVTLFIVDVNMPGIDGIELTRQIRTLEKYKFTPILVLTTEAQESKKIEGKKAGASGWLVKPFTQEILTSIVQRFAK